MELIDKYMKDSVSFDKRHLGLLNTIPPSTKRGSKMLQDYSISTTQLEAMSKFCHYFLETMQPFIADTLFNKLY